MSNENETPVVLNVNETAVVLNDNEIPIVPVSNWTLATGTRPGHRAIADTEARH